MTTVVVVAVSLFNYSHKTEYCYSGKNSLANDVFHAYSEQAKTAHALWW